MNENDGVVIENGYYCSVRIAETVGVCHGEGYRIVAVITVLVRQLGSVCVGESVTVQIPFIADDAISNGFVRIVRVRTVQGEGLTLYDDHVVDQGDRRSVNQIGLEQWLCGFGIVYAVSVLVHIGPWKEYPDVRV